MEPRLSLFGTRKQTQILLLIAKLGETHTRELARLLGLAPSTVLSVVDAYERNGVVATRKYGLERRTSLNPRFFAIRELKNLLDRLLEAEPEIEQIAASVRRRPRKRTKPLVPVDTNGGES